MIKERKTTSIKMDIELWDKFKIYAIQNKIHISELLERMIKKELEEEGDTNGAS